jgi:hypothetical protein
MVTLRAGKEWFSVSSHSSRKETTMAREKTRENDKEKEKERELTPDEIADLLTGGCDNLGMS